MKTYPAINDYGVMYAFEITSSWFRFAPLLRVLNSVDGVCDVTRNFFNENRVSFKYHGDCGFVNEPFGDNSRYYISIETKIDRYVDVSPIEKAFRGYRGYTIF